MPAIKSAAFCNNTEAGSGKTFLIFQLACEAAIKNKGAKILVINFSLYSDVSTLLMGGTKMAKFTAPPTGLQNTLDNTTPDTRTKGLVRDLVLHGNGSTTPQKSVFGAFFSMPTLKETSPLPDLVKYMVKPNNVNKAVPDNLICWHGLVGSKHHGPGHEQHQGRNPHVGAFRRRLEAWCKGT